MSKLEWPRGTYYFGPIIIHVNMIEPFIITGVFMGIDVADMHEVCLLYTSDAADDLLCVDLGGRRIIKKTNSERKELLKQKSSANIYKL